MLRGSGYLEPLLLLLILLILLPTRVASATTSATTTCDEDQRARRDACETELEEAAAGYLFPAVHWHPASVRFVDYVMIALLEGFPRTLRISS